jgi:hypothetical protein
MELNEVEITIDIDGQVRLEVHGVQGTACLELTQALEAGLGGKIISRQMTAEAFEIPTEDQPGFLNIRS